MKNDISGKVSQENELYIVGIGASAGGLEALESFFKNLPKEPNTAFVIVQHLSPDYESLMPQLLSNYTDLKVISAENGMRVYKNTIYLIPPNKEMSFESDLLFLKTRESAKTPFFPIDTFLKSLAIAKKKYAIGVILSGTGSDGSRGIRFIKEEGGIVMVQSTQSAKFDGMPVNAIATGLVDAILPVNEIPTKILSIINNPLNKQLGLPNSQLLHEDLLLQIFQIIFQFTGVDFSEYKRNTILRGIKRRMNVHKINTLHNYLKYLQYAPEEIKILQKEMLIGVTKFFRDEAAFEALQDKVIPYIFTKAEDNTIKIWITACSTGEEAYSIAMYFLEYLGNTPKKYTIKVFATDVDQQAIDFASTGRYPLNIAGDVKGDLLIKYFKKDGEFYMVKNRLRDIMIFSRHNLIFDPPFRNLDLISCRNVLIYLQTVLQRKILNNFSFGLKDSRYLFLGGSETIEPLKEQFHILDNRNKLYSSTGKKTSPSISISKRKPNFNVSDKNRTNTSYENFELKTISQLLLEDFGVACILINSSYEFVRHMGDAMRFIKVPERSGGWNLFDMIHDDLSVTVSTACRRAISANKSITYKKVDFKADGFIDISVKPFMVQDSSQTFVLIIFKEHQKAENTSSEVEVYQASKESSERIQDLEQELKITRENLQATIEELQTSNEELLASNEELQSTNEELQSVNEELYTINAEHQSVIVQLTTANDDINNLFHQTEIGILFLDENLRIRKLNNKTKEMINIIEVDVDREIENFSNNLNYTGFNSDIKNVLKTSKSIQKEIQRNNGKWILIKILPYDSISQNQSGVLITFVDISEIKDAERIRVLSKDLKKEIKVRQRAEKELRGSLNHLNKVNEVVPDFMFIGNNETGKVHFINNFKSFKPLNSIEEIDFKNFISYIYSEDIEKFVKSIGKIEDVKDGEILSITVRFQKENKEVIYTEVHFTSFSKNANGQLTEYLGIIRDVTEKEVAKTQLVKSQRLYKALFDNSFEGVLITDFHTKQFINCNKRFLELFNIEEGNIFSFEKFSPKRQMNGRSSYDYLLHNTKLILTNKEHTITYDWHFVNTKGEDVFCVITSVLLKSYEGRNRDIFVSYFQEVTDILVGKKEIEVQKNFKQSILKSMPQWIFTYNTVDNTIVFENDIEEQLDVPILEAINFKSVFNNKVHPDDRIYVLNNFNQVGEENIKFEFRVRNNVSLNYIWVKATITKFSDIEYLGILTDITNEKVLENEAKTVFDGIPDLYLKLGKDKRVIILRAGTAFRTYVNTETTIGKRTGQFLPPQVAALLEIEIDKILNGASNATCEYSLTYKDGSEKFSEARFFPTADGCVGGLIRQLN